MALIKRTDLPGHLKTFGDSPPPQIVLCLGERYLGREAADLLQQAILAASPGTVHSIDGDQEDPGQTLAKLNSFSLLPGRQIFRVSDSRIFHSKTVASAIWNKAVQAKDAGRPDSARRSLKSLLQLADIKPGSTTAFSEISADQWQKLFSFARPSENLFWADDLVTETGNSGAVAGKAAGIAEKYIAAFEKGLPPQNILILTAEEADRRQRLFTAIKKIGLVIDCAVAEGSGAAAQNEQKDILREMVQKTLKEFGKKIEPQALDIFFERVGFHPVAVVMETEKLALYAGDRPLITTADLDEMVGRSREDALFELTDAFGKKQPGRTLTILGRLQDNGTHGLAILSTMRNYLRKLMVFRSLQNRSQPLWHRGMNARQFQSDYLPALKETGEWPELLKGHPYAIYMSFTTAAEYSCATLKDWLSLLLQAEYRLKGSPLPQRLVLEELFLTLLGKKQAARKT
ncbi:MAG: DNA polymerase III subunit delta [Desulfoprunum sp.]|nr:DNA polymerase III subunit delta [Desulfoprunum sp.]